MPQEQAEKRLSGFDPRPIFQQSPGFNFGEGDLIVGGKTSEVLGRMAASYFTSHDADGRPVFKGITVITPPEIVRSGFEGDIPDLLLKGFEDLYGDSLTSHDAKAIKSMVKVCKCNQLNSNDVAAVIERVDNASLVLVAECAKYRTPGLVAMQSAGRTDVLLAEDTWVPHTAHLAQICLAAAKQRECFVVFSATEDAPTRDSNIKLLTDVEGLYPTFASFAGDSNDAELLRSTIPRWIALAASGRAKQAFDELERAHLSDEKRRQIALHVAARSGDKEKTLRLLQGYIDEHQSLPADVAARMGRTAYTFGDFDAASTFFSASLDNVSDQDLLEVMLTTSTIMNNSSLVARCWLRLHTLFPTSIVLKEDREFRLLQICAVEDASAQTKYSRAGFEGLHAYIADSIGSNPQAEYEVVLQHVRLNWQNQVNLAALCVATHANAVKNFESGIKFATVAANDARYEPQAMRLLLAGLRRMFLVEVRPAEGLEAYKRPLEHIVRHLAKHPGAARLRVELSTTLSVETAGIVGLPMLASLAISAAAVGAKNVTLPTESPAESSSDEFEAFIKNAYAWLAAQTVIEPGMTRLPESIVGGRAAALMAGLNTVIRAAASSNRDLQEDLKSIEYLAFTICALQSHVPNDASDLDALRLFAVSLWFRGQPQRARDIAEQILALAGESPWRKRLAWGHFADIYQRMRGPIDALIGLTCASATDAEINSIDLFHETYTLLRVTRDLQQFPIARQILATCKRLYDSLGEFEKGPSRLQGVELALDVAQAGELDEADMHALFARVQEHCKRAFESENDIFPAASLFLQVAGDIERAGGHLPPEAAEIQASLNGRLGTDTASFLRTVYSACPSVHDVVWLHNRIGTARNSEDTAGDQIYVVVAAHRLLLRRTPELSPVEAAVAIELLSDRSIELHSSTDSLNVQWPLRFIKNLSNKGLAVLMVATTSDGELVAIIAEQGEVHLYRPCPNRQSFAAAVNAWSTSYPYRYGLIEREDGNGEFFSTMAPFKIPMSSSKALLVVAEPMLQQLPFNVVLENGEFAGNCRAIGLAPSLTWFNAARQRPTNSSGSRRAWIPCSPQAEKYGTLELLLHRMESIYKAHQFEVNTSAELPDDWRDVHMAVVTAHGQLTSEQRYFHRISDEQHRAESPLALVQALGGVELVILFVCSGGRVDRHPLGNTTVSLPKMLLDAGSRTVLASPWPLSATVPGHWLEKFLAAWDNGDTVLDANFKANSYVRDRLGPEANLSLAMTVYGDVLLTK